MSARLSNLPAPADRATHGGRKKISMAKAKLPKGVEELPSGRYRAMTWNRYTKRKGPTKTFDDRFEAEASPAGSIAGNAGSGCASNVPGPGPVSWSRRSPG